MDAVVAHHPADLIVTVQAGVRLAELQEVLAASGQTLPLWHPDPDVRVGDLVDAGWLGLGRRLFGRLRDRVLEIRAVTGDGLSIRGGAKVVKNVTGFDLPRLFCGAGGRLGVLTEMTLKVAPLPRPLVAVSGEMATADLVAAAARVQVEAVVSSGRCFVFAPGPDDDARVVLSGFPSLRPDEEASFEDLARL